MNPIDDVVEDSEPERQRRRQRDNDEPESVFSCFAFTSTTTSHTDTVDPGPSRPTRIAREDHPDHFPDARLTQLSKCIACGLEWTSKKTPKQKRTHIGQCAKRNALTKDTIRILIEKEIALLSPTSNLHEKQTATLMDSVVPTGPVKKSKRQPVVPTVRSLPETRAGILHRARDILGPTQGQAEPNPTQQFGQSALARRNTQQPKRRTSLDLNRSSEEPPSTQLFGASSLSVQQVGTSMFSQDSIFSGYKRAASPMDGGSKTVRRRLA